MECERGERERRVWVKRGWEMARCVKGRGERGLCSSEGRVADGQKRGEIERYLSSKKAIVPFVLVIRSRTSL